MFVKYKSVCKYVQKKHYLKQDMGIEDTLEIFQKKIL